MIKCPNCESELVLELHNNSGTFRYHYCTVCECKYKYKKDWPSKEVNIITEGKQILLG